MWSITISNVSVIPKPSRFYAIQNQTKRNNMNTQFASNVHEFTENLFKAMLEEFDGKEVGSDEFNLETLMAFHFPNYTPGDKVKKMKKVNIIQKKLKLLYTSYSFIPQRPHGDYNRNPKSVKHGLPFFKKYSIMVIL